MKKSLLTRAAFAPVLEWIGFVVFGVFLLWQAKSWTPQTSEHFLQFVVALGLVVRPLRDIGEQISKYYETRGILARLGTLLARSSEHSVQQIKAKLPDESRVTIENLKFQNANTKILDIQNFTISKGLSYAILGPSGSGKSTFVKSLCGLIEPQIFIVKSPLSPEDVQSAVCYVSQHPFLFKGTIRENLMYGLNGSDAESYLEEVLKISCVDKDIQRFERGLETVIDPIHENISGGQKQRLTLARALLHFLTRKHKYILACDEASSAIDSQMERQLLDNMINLIRREKKILIWVTHRTDWVGRFDAIVSFADGSFKLTGQT